MSPPGTTLFLVRIGVPESLKFLGQGGFLSEGFRVGVAGIGVLATKTRQVNGLLIGVRQQEPSQDIPGPGMSGGPKSQIVTDE